MKLKNIRTEIDKIDEQIIRLLAKRFYNSRLAKVNKIAFGLKIKDKKREHEIIDKLENLARENSLSVIFVKRLYKVIFDESLRLQIQK